MIERQQVAQLIIRMVDVEADNVVIDVHDEKVRDFFYRVEETGGVVPDGIGRYRRHMISWTEPPITTPYRKGPDGS